MVRFALQLCGRYRSVHDLLQLRQRLSLEVKKDLESFWKDTIRQSNFGIQDNSENVYVLAMFPYPSGKLHMGHFHIYSASDVIARYYRLCGKNVIHPIGFDSFGLPAENAAIDNGIPPDEWTSDNIQFMRKQLKNFGLSFNWDREISTCNQDFYKWTQYLFLKLYESGLAYRKEALVNWDPIDKTVLANEQVNEKGVSWRSGAVVEKKVLKQWFVSTTRFSEDLLNGLDSPHFRNWDAVGRIQKNWIGNCNGYMFYFPVAEQDKIFDRKLEIWIDKPHLICGISFVVLAQDHYLNKQKYYKNHGPKVGSGDIEMTLEAVHPITQRRIPIFISSKIQCIQATDTYAGIPTEVLDDSQFAKKYNLPEIKILDSLETIINSGKFSGMDVKTGAHAILNEARENNFGGFLASGKLKDWLVSRQRYWGTPIPIVFCDSCGEVPVPENELPVELPTFQTNYAGRGVSLANYSDWVNTKCPKCGNSAKREIDTLDTFFDSSWYYLRYLSPNNAEGPVSKEMTEKFMPVDIYIGGIEHADLHLYYARLMNHFCYNIGMVGCKEPFQELFVQHLVYGKTYQVKSSGKYIPYGEVDLSNEPVEKSTSEPVEVSYQKMSKSKLNGVDPEEAIKDNSIDTVRLLMLGYDTNQDRKNWPPHESHVKAASDFEHRLWTLIFSVLRYKSSYTEEKSLSDEKVLKYKKELSSIRNYHLGRISHFYSQTRGISSVVHHLNHMLARLKRIPCNVAALTKDYERALGTLLISLCPVMPAYSSELWSQLATVCESTSEFDWNKNVLVQKWPEVDQDFEISLEAMIQDKKILTLKLPRHELESLNADEAIKSVLSNESVIKAIGNREVIKTRYTLIEQFKGIVTISAKKPKKEDLN